MRKTILLLTKDCMSLEALPCYGGCKYWEGKTPNIDALAKKGTMFMRHYTAGASTAMSMSAMLTGRNLYEFSSRKFYTKVQKSEFPSIYDKLQELGYETHLIWEKEWGNFSDFVAEFGDTGKLVYHGIDIDQVTDAHSIDEYLNNDDVLLEHTYNEVLTAFKSIDLNKKQFVWMHLPHILKGRNSYISDMDAFDKIVGFAREIFGDENIYLSTDHGHMNMHKHIAGYGFDAYEPIIHIPLITPRIEGRDTVFDLTCNTDIPEIILRDKLPEKHEFVIAETKYYAQPYRKIAIVKDRFKYIYTATENKEELFDLEWDPLENYNILERYHFDKDRKKLLFYDEHYFYPYKDIAMQEYKTFLDIKSKMWRELTLQEKRKVAMIGYARTIKRFVKKLIP